MAKPMNKSTSTKMRRLIFLPIWAYFFLALDVRCFKSAAFVIYPTASVPSRIRDTCIVYLSARNRAAKQQNQLQESWFPRPSTTVVDEEDIYGATSGSDDDDLLELESKSLNLMATLIRERLQQKSSEGDTTKPQSTHHHHKGDKLAIRNAQLAKGRFMDLTCTGEGERALEELFTLEAAATEPDKEVIQGAVIALQSLLIFGTQVGLKGSPAQLQRMVAHLDSRGDQEKFVMRDLETWDVDSVRRLKYKLEQAPAVQLLSEVQWKRSSQGAFDLLVAIGAWQKHEDLPLLRSGFSIRFTEEELEAADIVSLWHAKN